MSQKISIEEYINKRVNCQIAWYDKRAQAYQRKYRISQTLEIILAALIPLLSSYADNFVLISFIVGLFGAVIAIIKSLSRLYQWPENWIGYRTACDMLRYQKILFETGSAPYNPKPENLENIFIHNVEQIISAEHNQWKSLMLKQSDQEQPETQADS